MLESLSASVREIKVENRLVRVKQTGKGLPLFLLHGWGMESSYFASLIEVLKKEKAFSFLSFDWPGFGEAAHLDRSWTLSDYSDFLQKVVSELGFREYVVLGHSFGGSVLIHALSQQKIQPQCVILCGSSGIRFPKGFRNRCLRFIAKLGKKVFSLPGLNLFKKRVKKYFYRKIGSTDYLRSEKTPFLKPTLQNILRQDLRPFLKKIDLPVLLLWGKKDAYTPVWYAKIMDQELPRSELVILDDAAHDLLRVKSHLAAQKISQFIAKCYNRGNVK